MSVCCYFGKLRKELTICGFAVPNAICPSRNGLPFTVLLCNDPLYA